MNEGLILIDNNDNIISINTAACSLFNTDSKCLGKKFTDIIKDNEINKKISNSIANNDSEIFFDIASEKYRIEINQISSLSEFCGRLIVIFNITQHENTEIMRREFTANVSHELKTPLQSISGYAELLHNDLVKKEDIPNFGSKIYSEAQRMIHLIEDIIHLSRLDEGAAEMAYSTVDIYKIAIETAESLKPEADNMSVSIEVTGENAEMTAIPHLISGIIFNLCDNAIKYNKLGGKVSVNVKNTPNEITLTVSDTGIGIPAEDFSRVFERFYRVDKSHSKEVGGTGLGLSIVKHAAIIHNARITLESTLNIGTSITVTFPKKP